MSGRLAASSRNSSAGHHSSQERYSIKIMKDYLEQIQRIISILGTPSNEDQKFITNDSALKYIRGLPKRSKQNWRILFPNTSAEGLDLLEKMLTFNPNKRVSVAECIQHPYFEEYDQLE